MACLLTIITVIITIVVITVITIVIVVIITVIIVVVVMTVGSLASGSRIRAASQPCSLLVYRWDCVPSSTCMKSRGFTVLIELQAGICQHFLFSGTTTWNLDLCRIGCCCHSRNRGFGSLIGAAFMKYFGYNCFGLTVVGCW